jgi:hypothetical protein
MKIDLRFLWLLTCAPLLACPEPAPADSETGTETAGDGDGDTGDGDGDGDSGDGDGDGDSGDGDGDAGDGDGDADVGPEIVSFTVNGATTPGLVNEASGVIIEAEITDPDMNLDYVVFERDGEQIAMFVTPGPNFVFEWVVSGQEFDGTYEFIAQAYDADDNMAVSDPVSVSIGMAEGGTEVEQWTHDGGNLDALYGLHVDHDGTSVTLTGQTTQNAESRQRTDRVVGPAWTDKVEDASLFGAAVTRREDGGYFVAGTIPKPNDKLDSAIYSYDDAGTLLDSRTWNGTSQVADDADNSIKMQAVPGGVVVLGAYYASGGPKPNNWLTYIRHYTDELDEEWTRFPTETLAGRIFAYDFAAASDGSFVLVGGQFDMMPIQPWIGMFDANGLVVDEIEINDFTGGVIHGVAIGEDGGIVVGGQVTVDGQARSWVRSYGADLTQGWEVDVPNVPLAIVAAVAVDPFGEVVTVATENCETMGFRYVGCDLAVRKYDAEGVLMWEQTFATGQFLGPNLALLGFDASVAVDRFGYIYVTAIPETMAGTDWWARKLNP